MDSVEVFLQSIIDLSILHVFIFSKTAVKVQQLLYTSSL